MTIAEAKAYLNTNYGTYGTWDIPGDPESTFTNTTPVSVSRDAAQYYSYNRSAPNITVDSKVWVYCFDDPMSCTGGIAVQYGVFSSGK